MTGVDEAAGAIGAQEYILLALLFAGFFLAFEAVLLSFTRRAATRSDLNRRLSRRDASPETHAALVSIRQKRSLSPDGEYTMPMVWLNRLIVQSGVTWGVGGLCLVFSGSSVGTFALVVLSLGNQILAALLAVFAGAGIPLLLLTTLRNRRRRKFEAQLPEAIDVLVRSLKVGHPVSAAIRMVVRELQDPIGTEFGIVADELTYGLDLETAIDNMNRRVGQQDLALVVVAIGIQTKSGGNLAEILGGISKVIRDRLRMRLKVNALSAEGRFSALLLSVLPFGLFGLLCLIAPQFYGDVWMLGPVKPVLVAATGWMMIGDLIMYRMVNFEI